MVARSCLTFCSIRGMMDIGGKAYPVNPSHRKENASSRHTAGSRVFVQYLRSWALSTDANRSTECSENHGMTWGWRVHSEGRTRPRDRKSAINIVLAGDV